MGQWIPRFLFSASLLVALASSQGRADTPALPREVVQLNKLTGNDPPEGALSELLRDEARTKKLVADALPLARAETDPPLSYNAALVLGHAAAKVKDMKASETYLRVCMKQAVKLQSTRKLLESFGGLVEQYYKNNQFGDAARVCRELMDLKTDDGTPRIVYRAFTTRLGDVDFMEDDNFDAARRLRPTIHQMLIKAIAKQGKFDQAIRLADALIKQQDHWLERQLKGWVLREAGQFDEAANVYEDVIGRVAKDSDLDAETRDEYTTRYRYEISNLYVEMNKIDKAAEHLNFLIGHKPKEPGFYNDLGYIWADHDMKLDDAEKLIRKALDLDRERRKANPDFDPKTDRDNGAYLDSLGWVLFKQKKLPAAKEALEKAIEDRNSQHIEIYDHLGDVQMALGERAAAVAAWERGLKLHTDSRRDQERRAALEKKLEKARAQN